MYTVYLFKVKATNEVIYVGSTARMSARLKEHRQQLRGSKKTSRIHRYMNKEGLRLYKDVEVVLVDCAETREEMLKLEEEYYFEHLETILNDRPAENKGGSYNPRRRKVKCLNDGKVFKTVTDCAKYYRKGRTTISNVLNGEKEYTRINDEKYYFEYVNQ